MEEDIDFKHIPIVFAHNVYNRFDCLSDTIKIEKELYPDSKSVVAFNDINPEPFLEKKEGVEYHSFSGKTHKIGCTNGCITSIQQSWFLLPNVVVFSHDDVRINPMYKDVVQKNIDLILSGEYDIICRKPSNIYGKNYYMMEVFYMSLQAAEQFFKCELFESEFDIPKDQRGSISPEVWLYQTLNAGGKFKILEKEYHHQLEHYNVTLGQTLGYYHEMIGERGWIRN